MAGFEWKMDGNLGLVYEIQSLNFLPFKFRWMRSIPHYITGVVSEPFSFFFFLYPLYIVSLWLRLSFSIVHFCFCFYLFSSFTERESHTIYALYDDQSCNRRTWFHFIFKSFCFCVVRLSFRLLFCTSPTPSLNALSPRNGEISGNKIEFSLSLEKQNPNPLFSVFFQATFSVNNYYYCGLHPKRKTNNSLSLSLFSLCTRCSHFTFFSTFCIW